MIEINELVGGILGGIQQRRDQSVVIANSAGRRRDHDVRVDDADCEGPDSAGVGPVPVAGQDWEAPVSSCLA